MTKRTKFIIACLFLGALCLGVLIGAGLLLNAGQYGLHVRVSIPVLVSAQQASVTPVTPNKPQPTTTAVPRGWKPTPGRPPIYAAAQQKDVAGGINLSALAQLMNYANVHNVDNTIYGWYWFNSGEKKAAQVDFSKACHEVYGPQYEAVPPTNGDVNKWRCQVPEVATLSGQGCSGSLTSQLKIGDEARNTSGITLHARETPKVGGGNLFLVTSGSYFSIIDGPKCGENRTWWLINMDGNEGWLPEANNLVYNYTPVQVGGLEVEEQCIKEKGTALWDPKKGWYC